MDSTEKIKLWPFVETPGQFAGRLERARIEFRGDVIAACRNVLIEDPAVVSAEYLAALKAAQPPADHCEDSRGMVAQPAAVEDELVVSRSSARAAVISAVIEIEKLLCEKLGRKWSPTGFSVETLIDDLASRPQPSAPAQPATDEPVALTDFDAAVAAELPCVSVVPYNSHEICKWFAGNVRERMIMARPQPAPDLEKVKPRKVDRPSDFTVSLTFNSCAEASRFVASIGAQEKRQ